MLKENKLRIFISSLITLLPLLFGLVMWDSLPGTVAVHWGPGGNWDRFSGRAFAVFGLPLIMLAAHLLCLFITAMDKRQKNQDRKALSLIFWIIPFLSLFTSATIYSAALGMAFSVARLIPAVLGLLFIFIGNYLPKTRQNSSLGIRLPWTMRNEENWNKTHRLSGRLWVLGGIIMAFSVFLPSGAMITVPVLTVLVMLAVPAAYSYSIYKKHKEAGIIYTAPIKGRAERVSGIIAAILISLIIIAVIILMFTGNIELSCGETALHISADYWEDLQLRYDEIDSISYREDFEKGIRSYGFGSARLSVGNFENDEFGSYTLYACGGAEAYIVLGSGDNTLVIGMEDAGEAREIYDTLLEKTCG